jgi:hypothetical protein
MSKNILLRSEAYLEAEDQYLTFILRKTHMLGF